MTCPVCGRYAEPDRETGYDVDCECGLCQFNEEAEKIDPIDSDLRDMGSVLASLADLVKDCKDPAKLFDVYAELKNLAVATMTLQDKVGLMLYVADPHLNSAKRVQ